MDEDELTDLVFEDALSPVECRGTTQVQTMYCLELHIQLSKMSFSNALNTFDVCEMLRQGNLERSQVSLMWNCHVAF